MAGGGLSMAEFCLDCFNELCLPERWRKRSEQDVTLSDEPELCEGCGEYKLVVVLDRPEPFWRRWIRNRRQRS